jgi:hypothetical protein
MSVLLSTRSSEAPIRSAPVDLNRWDVLWPRLRLYVDRLEVTRWWGWRRVWRRLPLTHLEQVQAPSPTTLRLHPDDRDALTLQVDAAREWARLIRAFRACLNTGNRS